MSGRPNGQGGEEIWASAFTSLPPKTTLQTLRGRIQKSQQFNESLSEIFDKRAAIEMEYVEKLAKLGRKVEEKGNGPVGTGTGEGKSLGGEAKCWEMVLKEMNETCALHTSFSNSLTSDLLPPIRDMHNNISLWGRVGVMDGNVEKVVKAWDSARTKVDKAQKKGGPKLTAAQSELMSLTSDLEIQTPTIYTAYQQLEAVRLDRLKETLVKWETVRSDLGRGVLEGSERGMNVLLGWDVERDVEEVARRLGGGGSTAGRTQAASMTPSSRRQTMSSDHQQPPSSYSGSPARNNTTSHDNGSLTNLPQSTSITSTLKSKFGRKNSVMGGSPGFLANRDRSGSNVTTRSNGRTATGGANAFETLTEPTGDGYDTIRRPSDLGRKVTAPPNDFSGATAQTNVDSEGFSVPPANRDQAPWERSDGAPRNLMDDDNDEHDSVSALPPMSAAPSANSTGKYNLAMAPLPIQENEAERQAALAKVQSTLLAAPPSGSNAVNRRSTMRGRRDVRNTTFQAVPDDMPLAQALKLKGIQTDALNQRSASPTTAMVESPTSGVFNTGSFGAQQTPASAFAINSFGGSTMDRQASTMSATSSALSNNPFDGHPLPTAGPGLRASITETVNVLSRGGVVSRAMVTGEITLALRDLAKITAGGASPGAIHIRLDQFEQLEKVAPNPKYLAQVPDRPGEYFLNSEVLAQVTSAAGQQPVLFKYQLHVGEGRAQGFAPIEVHAQWKTMENETRLLLTYSASEDSRLYGQLKALEGSEKKVTDITIIAALGGAGVTSVQAKPPGGTWTPESHRMTWKVDDLAFGESSKIAARFLMDGLGVPEGVTVRWRIEGCLSSGLGLSVVEPASAGETVGKEGWRFEEVRKAVVSGKYIAEPA